MNKDIFLVSGIVLFPVLLSACGGGGSDSDSNPQTVRINGTTEVYADEGAVSEFPLENNIKSIKTIEGSPDLTLRFSGRSLVVDVAELTRPTIGTYDVYMSKGEDTLIQRFEVMGVNTSAASVEGQAYDIKHNYQALLDLEGDKRVYEYFVDLAYLKEVITPSVRGDRINAFDVSGASTYAATKSSFDELLVTFDQYLNGETGEDTLKASADIAAQNLALHSEAGLTFLRDVEDLSGPVMATLPDTDVVYVEPQMRFSRFFAESMLTSNPDTGATEYAAGYTILTPLTGI